MEFVVTFLLWKSIMTALKKEARITMSDR